VSTLSGSSLTASQPTGFTWLTQPTPQTVQAGSSVSFNCSADYSKKIQRYEWERNNKSLENDDLRYAYKDDRKTLEISQTKFEDRGDYRCVATRKGKVLGYSQNAALNVKGKLMGDTLLLSRNLGRSFFVLELLAPLSLSGISRGLFSLVFGGPRLVVWYNRLHAC